jgi:N6-L-threonylcarbamoyladenine synthase
MLILAIESSCDETSVALVENGKNIIANLVSSQIDIHSQYGGVVPEVASRQHIKVINLLMEEVLQKNNIKPEQIDLIAATFGPGLQGSLLIGLLAAKTLAWMWNKPLMGVNHLEGHIYSPFIEHDLNPPMITLLVSGGHTEIIHFQDFGKYELIGKTKDDAVGEAFDKVARLLDLPYPGGPQIDKLAQSGNPEAFKFPKAMPTSYDFSFSGIKTSVLYKVRELEEKGEVISKEDISASFSQAVAETLVKKTIKAALEKGVKTISVSGGVAANSFLRKEMTQACEKNNFTLYFPSMKYCTDNAAMIGCAAYYKALGLDLKNLNGLALEAVSRIAIG